MKGLLGLRAQSMAARKSARVELLGFQRKSSGSGTITSPAGTNMAEAYLQGTGGGCTGITGGGGGGGAAYKLFDCPEQIALSYEVGATSTTDGGDTTIRLPTGGTVRAEGGKGAANGGTGGYGSGGDEHRRGGNGATAVSTAGTAGEFGGAGGAGNASAGGGGGGAGFSDLGDLALGGVGNTTDTGAGSVGNQSGPGGQGELVLIFYRVTA